MLTITARVTGDIDIDGYEIQIDCPKCGFSNPIWIRQARLRDVVICRGCKSNIQLDDRMNTVKKACESIRRQFEAFRRSVEGLFR